LEEQYRRHLSGFTTWNQLGHAEEWILFKENIGGHLSIDEVAPSQGELYTVITNKSAKGRRKGAPVAMVSGTVSENVIRVLKKIPKKRQICGRGNNLGYGTNHGTYC